LPKKRLAEISRKTKETDISIKLFFTWKFFTRELTVLGVYPASPFRTTGIPADND